MAMAATALRTAGEATSIELDASPARIPAAVIDAVAHDMRTPIASMSMTIDLLLDEQDRMPTDDVRAMLRRLQRGTVVLQTLLENLVGLTAIEGRRLPLRLAAVSVAECLDAALPIVHPLLDQKDQRVRVLGPAASTVIRADAQRVGQVLLNLLVNAAKYSVAGDVIDVAISTSGSWARIRVSDHGPGISDRDQRRIFDRYARGANAVTCQGLGLGLSIVRSLVELHGGSVGVESRPGHGASFWVTFPLAGPREVSQPADRLRWRQVPPAVVRPGA